MGRRPSTVAALLWCVIALGSFVAVHANDSLCLASSGTATWCTPADTDCLADIALLVSECSDSSRLNIVIDELYTSQPSDDASANDTSSSSSISIEWFVQNVTSLVGSREVLYVLEPYALTTLSESSGSDELNSFAANMEMALGSLSSNANAQVYLGLGSSLPESDSNIASLLKLLFSTGTLQGVVLDDSMGNSVEEIAEECSTFRQEFDGASSMSCIIDTSAVVATTSSSSSQSMPSSQSAGCANAVSPTADTGLDNVAYFVWLTSPANCSSDDYSLTSIKYDDEGDTESTDNSDSSTSSTASSSTSASASSKATPSPSSTTTTSSSTSTKTSSTVTPSPSSTSAASDSSSASSQSVDQRDDNVSSSASSSGSSASSDRSTSSSRRSSSSRLSSDSSKSSSGYHTSSVTKDDSTVSVNASSASASGSSEANAYSAKRSDGITSSSGSTTSTAATTVGKSTDAKIGVIAGLGVLGVGAVAVVLAAARRAQQQARAPSPPRYRVSSFLSSDVVFLDTY